MFGMIIWYEVLFAINYVSKKSQSKEICINGLINIDINGLIALIFAKQIAKEINVELKFEEKRTIMMITLTIKL